MATFTKKDVETIVEANDNPKEPNNTLEDASIKYKGLTEQGVENRKVKPKHNKDVEINKGRGPLYEYRMEKKRKTDSDNTT